MSIDFHQLRQLIVINYLQCIINYVDYIDCVQMIDSHRLGTQGNTG